MMMNDQSTAGSGEHLTALIGLVKDLVALMADPKATRRRLAELAEQIETAKSASARAAADRAEADAHLADVEDEIDAARERHGNERDAHQAAMAEREKDVREKERHAADYLKAAEADRADAATKPA
jgi:hypothetical protein